MSYKTIVVEVEDCSNLAPRLEIAARIAARQEAHLIGIAVTGVARYLHKALASVRDDPNSLDSYVNSMRRRAEASLDKFQNIARQAGVASIERRVVDDEIAGGVTMQARCCDLVVIGQPDPNDTSSPANPAFPEYVVMNSGSPALIVPCTGAVRQSGENILVAWNASIEAVRSVHHALPLLKQAAVVQVAIFNPESSPDLYGSPPGADIAHYLARHGIKVDVLTPTVEGPVGDALLDLAGRMQADLIVMGCYGHSRFREVVLGGTTQAVLKSSRVPVLMAH